MNDPPKKTYNIDNIKAKSSAFEQNAELITIITNKLLDLIILEISKNEMKETIKAKIIHPLLYILYCQLYPYIYGFVILMVLMFSMLAVLLIFFIIYLKK